MATDIAANSDSTLTYSHGASSPVLTSPESASTMWVWGEIGYAGMTSGRHSATVSATAREPSICLSGMTHALQLTQYVAVGRGGRRGVPARDFAREARADRGGDRVERDDAGERREAAQQRGVRQRPADVLACELAGGHGQNLEVLGELGESELGEAAAGVDEDVPALAHPAEDVDLVQQRRVLHDQRVGLHDGLADADLPVVDAAERHDRRTGALRAEARERLRVALLEERGEREQLGRRDDALAAAAVDADCEHAPNPRGPGPLRHPWRRPR